MTGLFKKTNGNERTGSDELEGGLASIRAVTMKKEFTSSCMRNIILNRDVYMIYIS